MNRVADDGGENEGGHRADDVDGGLPSLPGGEQLHGSLDQNMQEVRQLAFVDQRDLLREFLQQGCTDQRVEVRRRHVSKQWEVADQGDVGSAHKDTIAASMRWLDIYQIIIL